MPIYEYACRECGRRFETLVRSGSEPACPGCGSQALDKQLSVFATASLAPERAPAFAGPCGSCGHPDGPGACGMPPH